MSASVLNGGGFVQQAAIANVFEVTVPPGYEIRLVAVRAVPAAVFTEGEEFHVLFGRGAVAVAEAGSAELGPSFTAISAFIGGQANPPRSIQTVVATGVQVFSSAMELATMALPDIWWDRNVRVTIRSTLGLSFAATAITEVRHTRS
jgi:hypothetical protein